MDEIDAALDFRNVSIVANYIKDRTKNAQFIIISLRNNMFELADRLIGIYKTHNCTKTITINPSNIMPPVAFLKKRSHSILRRASTFNGDENDENHRRLTNTPLRLNRSKNRFLINNNNNGNGNGNGNNNNNSSFILSNTPSKTPSKSRIIHRGSMDTIYNSPSIIRTNSILQQHQRQQQQQQQQTPIRKSSEQN
ncbi:hypothetical protein BCR32DRAFT_9991 [Anaeromyces robustus]|uniref:RecF/RecN/SMC N-terminal domain-containing protein n=1 Tax=Anaeromyces robustus TaxID=1754192 RepID=A0A1Y1X822_9FUNG|nr:hypothetical protein BCR32DRAFT_9991 [Anaeromyces robustus]|eukprot:ORX81536.1 hypothetical protein BCR32DRAFT_9991 [Anaeromyces robustus]